jgi:hypothetical protein
MEKRTKQRRGQSVNQNELLRVWVRDGTPHFEIATGVWPDPAAWGILLVDIAQHVSHAYEQSEGRPKREVLARIREGFDAEWSAPNPELKGNLVGE